MKLIMENWREYLNEEAGGLCYPFANKMASKWIDDAVRTMAIGKGDRG